MIRIHIITLGCPKNMTDSRRLLADARGRGVCYVDEPASADAVLINTCGFIRDAKEESISEILKLGKLKEEGWAGRLVVIGCLAERYRDELAKEIPEIDAVFGMGEDEKIIAYCLGLKGKRPSAGAAGRISAAHGRLPGVGPSYAYLKIADGCDRRCAFCVIPSIRGRFRRKGAYPGGPGYMQLQGLRRGVRAYGFAERSRLHRGRFPHQAALSLSDRDNR
jgi:ribosomal protein S12 methylthiotransferase